MIPGRSTYNTGRIISAPALRGGRLLRLYQVVKPGCVQSPTSWRSVLDAESSRENERLLPPPGEKPCPIRSLDEQQRWFHRRALPALPHLAPPLRPRGHE